MKKIGKRLIYIVSLCLFTCSRLLTISFISESKPTWQEKKRAIKKTVKTNQFKQPIIRVTYRYTKKKTDFQKIGHKLAILEKNFDIKKPHQSGTEFGKIARQLSGNLLYGKTNS